MTSAYQKSQEWTLYYHLIFLRFKTSFLAFLYTHLFHLSIPANNTSPQGNCSKRPLTIIFQKWPQKNYSSNVKQSLSLFDNFQHNFAKNIFLVALKLGYKPINSNTSILTLTFYLEHAIVLYDLIPHIFLKKYAIKVTNEMLPS